jgi:uncharacterized zinc-type alcohol dehydrogenase-like protein
MKVDAWAAKEQGARLTPWSFDIEEVGPVDVVVEVTACGICYSDVHMIDNDWASSTYPLVAGHEVVGTVVETGAAVRHLAKGDRVGIGWQGSACLACPDCMRGEENLCDRHEGLIVTGHGGFASHVKVHGHFAFLLPDGVSSRSGGPLLCGGVTVYSALRAAGMGSGQRIGVIGVGGLGHMAVMFASRLGNQVTVFTSSDDKAEMATSLGATDAVVLPAGVSPRAPTRRLDLLLSTVPASLDWPAYLEWLDSDGTMVLVAGSSEPVSFPFWSLLGKRRRIMGSPIGGRAVMAEMLDVADRYGIEPMVEVFSSERINEALDRVRSNKVRYRAVIEV